MTAINTPHHPWAKRLESIGRPCVIDGTFYCVCGASSQRDPIVHEGDLRRFHACESCGRVQPIYPDSIFPAATPESSTSTASVQAAPRATDGGGAGRESPDDARPGGAAAAVRVSQNCGTGVAPVVPDFDAEAASLMKRAISDAMSARFLIASERAHPDPAAPRDLVALWRLADNLDAVVRELKQAITRNSKRPFRQPTGRV